MVMESPLSCEEVDNKHVAKIAELSTGSSQSYAEVRIQPSGCMLTKKFFNNFPRIRDFQVFPDDTWVISFPKCGTTWTQELVWLLKNNLDYEAAKKKLIRDRFPFIELESIMNVLKDEFYPDTIELAANSPRPRFIKTHLPPELLPTQIWTVKPKIVYVARNPNDAVVSYYHHHRLWSGYIGTFSDFFDAFIEDAVMFAPYWTHVLQYWKHHKDDNLLFNSFEDMKKDLPTVIRKTATFFDVALTDDDVEDLCNHLSFKSMKNNESVNYMDVGEFAREQGANKGDKTLAFMREGESGGWKKVFTESMNERMTEWTKQCLKGTEFESYPW